MTYINLLTDSTLIQVMGLGLLTVVVIAVIEAVYYAEEMGDDSE